jgi:hypothetical protein
MIRITYRQLAPRGRAFAPDAFEPSLGREIPFLMGDEKITATVLAVSVSESGRSAEITLKLPVTFPELIDDIETKENEHDQD